MANTFLRKNSNNINTTLTAVGNYTVGENLGAVVIGMSVSNTSASQVFANVSIYNGATDHYVIRNTIIPAESTLVVAGGEQKMILQPGDSIRVSASGNVDAIMNIMESSEVGISTDPLGYFATANVSTVGEGNLVNFTVTTTNVPTGTILYYTIAGNVSTADFTDNQISNSFTITDGVSTVIKTLSNDVLTEGPETLSFEVRTGSIAGDTVAIASAVLVEDTSTPYYSITPNISSVNEGNTVSFTITTNVGDGNVIYWNTNGTASGADFSDSSTTGNVTISSGSATINRGITADSLTEGEQYFNIRIYSDSGYENNIGTSANVVINDTSVPSPPLNEAYYAGYYYPGITSSTPNRTQVNSFTLLSNISAISANVGAASASSYHFTYIKTDGTWWYYAPSGLTLGSTSTYTPSQVDAGSWDYVALAFDSEHMFGINSSGELYTAGNNSNGQLGLNDTTNRTYSNKAKVGSATNWTKACGAKYASIGLRDDGTVWCWGMNSGAQAGQLGVGGTSDVLVPTQVGSDTNWVDIAAAPSYGTVFYGLKSNGTLWYWGDASYGGGLGQGDTLVTTPTQIGVATNWAKIYGTYRGARLIKTNGTLWGPYSSTGYTGGPFQQIGSDTDWSISEGATFQWHAIKNNGTLWAINVYNFYGAAGTGNTTDVLVPTQVGSDTNWRNLAPTGQYYGAVAIK